KVIIAIQSTPEIQVNVPNKTRLYQPEAGLRQYAIEHKMNPEKFSVITEAEKTRDIRFYHGGIERKEDPRKYHKFLTDRERLIGEELLRRGILKSGLSTAWLDNLMEKWEKIHTQFIQIFS
ncbi:3955_t:CDS:2, partial [Gigaspora rosea]